MADHTNHKRDALACVAFLIGVLMSNGARAIGMSQLSLCAFLVVMAFYHTWKAPDRAENKAWDAYRATIHDHNERQDAPPDA